MRLPSGHFSFTKSIVDKCYKYIDYGFWSGIKRTTLQRWLNNFDSDEEKYFSAVILDKLIYRSNEHVIAFLYEFIFLTLPSIIYRKYNIEVSGNEVYNELQGKSNPWKIKLFPSLSISDPNYKSGFFISRLLKKHLKVNGDAIIDNNYFEKGLYNENELYIIFDDFSGTGEQFIDNIYSLGESFYKIFSSSNNFIFHPLIIHEAAISNIKAEFSRISVSYIELLKYEDSILTESEGNRLLINELNTEGDIQDFYFCMLKKYDIEVTNENQFGFGNLGLVCSFQDTAPDNSIPLLWYPYSSKFTELFNR